MKKTLLAILTGLLFLTGVGTGIGTPITTRTTTDTIHIAAPHLTTNENTLTLTVDGSVAQLLDPGKPILPIIAKTYTFPFGTRVTGVTVDLTTQDYHLQQKIAPTPERIVLDTQLTPTDDTSVDAAVYLAPQWYPAAPYTIDQTVGIVNGIDQLCVTIKIIPQYIAAQDLLRMPTAATIHISYVQGQTQKASADDYDLLIITDQSFVSALQPLAEHKNDTGIRTKIVTVQDIYANYHGRDNPESIKLKIYDEKQQHNITYVLLAGGRKGETHDWIIPERVTHNPDDFESGTASDLYYGDIYRVNATTNQTEFEDWDSNGNGIFAEFATYGPKKDIIDYVPDVYVGRLDFRQVNDIKPVVDKIIKYENGVDNSWFKTIAAFAGDTAPPARGPAKKGYYEGEIATNISCHILEGIGFTADRFFLSQKAWNGTADVVKDINKGYGFIHFSGHGNPAYWGNFKPDSETEDGMTDGLILRNMPTLTNGEKLPVVIVGGCHNAQFNVTMANIMSGIKEYGFMGYFLQSPYRFFYKEWVPRCWCSEMVFVKKGGSISATGCSGLGLGYVDAIGLSDWLENRFFDAYANQSIHILGATHGTAIADYVHLYGMCNRHYDDRKTVEEFTLIGDPSLRIGGV